MFEPSYVQNPDVLLGKRVLGFIRYLDHEGNDLTYVEVYGLVTDVSDNTVLIDAKVWRKEESSNDIDVEQVSKFSLPFCDENYWCAEDGDYKSILSEERIPNPDFLTQWKVHPPED